MAKDVKVLRPAALDQSHRAQIFRHETRKNGFAWHQVDHALILTAFATCLDGGHALMLSSAMGGRGVCIRIMKGRGVEAEVEYAGSGHELNEWLRAIINFYQSSSEDALLAMQMILRETRATGD